MKTQLVKYEISNMLHDTGDDMTHFLLFIKTENHTEAIMPLIIPYEYFYSFFKESNPEIFNYLTKIRRSISGYGPKHSKIITILNDEEFDFESHLQNYLNEFDPIHIEKHFANEKLIQQPETQAAAKEVVADFKNFFEDGYKEHNIKISEFTDELDQTIHELTLKYFPELFEMSPEHIEKYRDRLCRTTLGFVEDIDKILNDNID
jgi:hypothetical protein